MLCAVLPLYCMNIGSMSMWTFWGIIFYSAADAPYWKKGAIALLGGCAVMFCYMWLVVFVSLLFGDVRVVANIIQVDRKTMKKYGDGMGENAEEPIEVAENEKETSPTVVTEKKSAST